MKATSNDLGLRVIEAIQANVESQAEMAERYDMSQSFLEKRWQRFRTTGKYSAKAHAGGAKRALREDEAVLRPLIQAQPEATLAELCERVAEQTGKPVVMMDNLSVQQGIQALIEGRGAQLIYWPPYSPNLNPIEKCWSKIKTALRQAKARTISDLEKALQAALIAVSTEDAQGWFASCGYS